MKCLVILFVCCFIAMPCGAAADTQALELKSGEILIVVRDYDGKVCSGESFQIRSEKGELLKTIKLDDDGQATLSELADGSYKMVFPARGVLPFSVNQKSDITSLDLTIPPAPTGTSGDSQIALPVHALHVIGVVGVVVLAILLL